MGQLAEFAANHPFLVLGLLASWALVLVYELRLRSQSSTHLSPADAVRIINGGAIVVDVRKPEEYQAGHIVNARNVSLASLETDPDALKRQKSKVLLTVCENGAQSAKAASLLRKSGHEKVVSLKGGLTGWREQNLPLVK